MKYYKVNNYFSQYKNQYAEYFPENVGVLFLANISSSELDKIKGLQKFSSPKTIIQI